MTTTANPSTSVTETVEQEGASAPAKKGRARAIALGALAAAALGVGTYYVMHEGLEDTDDAQVDADVTSVPARISGPVLKVLFEENQPVKAGDLLVEVDPAQAKARLDEAEAQLAADKAAAEAADSDIAIIEATALGQKGQRRRRFVDRPWQRRRREMRSRRPTRRSNNRAWHASRRRRTSTA